MAYALLKINSLELIIIIKQKIMGACESAGCASKKYAKPPRNTIKRIVSKPTNLDLDSSMDEYEVKLERQSNLLAKKVDN